MAAETVNITLLGTSDLHGTFVPGLRQRHGESGGQPEPDSHSGEKGAR
ncbi:hypothetical protein M8494_37715 [Serratia ureilytica]